MKCNENTSATKCIRLSRLPDILVVHLKRFQVARTALTNQPTMTILIPNVKNNKYMHAFREKIMTHIEEAEELKLQDYVTDSSLQSSYRLFATVV